MIELKNISKKFGKNEIFNDFNLKITDGDYICLYGESGCGKTTLLNIIGCIDDNYKGKLVINGLVNPFYKSKIGRKLVKDDVGYLFQNFGLSDNDTVDYNLNIYMSNLKGSKSEKNTRKLETLSRFNLQDNQFSKIHELSGGEQQRVAISGIILKNPSIIIADEPTGSLDIKNRDFILDILDEFSKQGKNIVVVSHDPEVVQRANKCINL